jgi:hypothetical protein
MDEKAILQRINDLVEEEHRLRESVRTGTLSSTEERTRLTAVEASLDQAWDLLRRRRSAPERGEDPDRVTSRTVGEVEGYLQ